MIGLREQEIEVDLDRTLQVADLRLVYLGRELEELDLVALVVRDVGTRAEDLGEVRPIAKRVVAALEPLERRGVMGLVRDHALEEGRRPLAVEELRLVE